MSEKRKFESNADSEEESDEDIQSVKRKPEEESVDDEEKLELKRLEEKYDKRYTEEDPEYKACLERPDPSPPILINYYGKRNRGGFGGNDNRSGWRGRGGHRNDYRDNYRDNNRDNYRDNRRDNWNQRPNYNRY